MKNYVICVIGRIWEPGKGVCAHEYRPDHEKPLCLVDTEDEPGVNRALAVTWLGRHAGDFETIEDFTVWSDESGIVLDWMNQDSDDKFYKLMF